ncbi:Gliomedin [Dissostichus eleginoides]|uniref:Gliomedin n=1 Tax=Dissostichus eleginoides TaxID=100907 RepID=A0AAD9BSD3_DISEL|nr:Gliomedin [Dissostichus eleginoides]
MKERSGVCLAWKVLLLVGLCALLLLSSGALVFLLVRQKELTEELVRLEAQMQELSQSCRLQAGILNQDPAEARELRKLQRSRRHQEEDLTQEEKDMMMMMAYSMVPVHLAQKVCQVERGLQDNRECPGWRGDEGGEDVQVKKENADPKETLVPPVLKERPAMTFSLKVVLVRGAQPAHLVPLVLFEPPTPHAANESQDVLNVTAFKETLNTSKESESVSGHPEYGHDTLNETNSENVTEASIRLLTAPLSQDQNSGAFNGSGNITDIPMKIESPTPHPTTNRDVSDSEKLQNIKVETESPTPHSTDNNRDVSDSEKHQDIKVETESVSLYPGNGHGALKDIKSENATEATLTLLTAPDSADQNNDAFKHSGTIIDKPMKGESPTPYSTEIYRDVSDSEKHQDTTFEAASLSVDLERVNNTGNINDTPMERDSSHLLQTINRINVKNNKRLTKTECNIRNIKCSEKATKMQSTFGAWMSDASQVDQDRYWLADHFSGRNLVEHRKMSASPDTRTKTIDAQGFFQGCGHVVYKSSFYFHNGGSNRLIKFDLNTRRTKTLTMANSRYNHLNYLSRNSKTYFKFAVDENGLWVIFAADTEDDTMVAKLNPDTFSVESVINTHYPTTKAGNAFIVCGVLYFTDDSDRRVTYAFDLMRVSPWMQVLI